MLLKQLNISGIRNLKSTRIQLSSGFNLFVGQNGSGKTSILEAIHVLSLGRSFRTSKVKQAITFDTPACVVSGIVCADLSPFQDIRVGMERSQDGDVKIVVGEKTGSCVSELTSVLPVQLINASSNLLLDGGPKERRQFIDWGVFHVEHAFLQDWKRFQAALKQRNASLKQGYREHQEISSWQHTFVDLALGVDKARREYLSKYSPILVEIASEMLENKIGTIEVNYVSGWNDEISLSQALEEAFGIDSACGYTTCGPHRADLAILIDGVPAKEVLSRGQLKLFVFAMLATRAQLLQKQQEEHCIFLIDDLNAELDEEACGKVINKLQEYGGQTLITAIDGDILMGLLTEQEKQVFHVEHGKITEETLFHVEQ